MLSAALTNAQAHFPLMAQQTVAYIQELVHGKQYTRTVEFKTKYNQWGYQMSDNTVDHRNNFLQKAVTLKVASEKDYDFETAQISLTQHTANKNKSEYDSDEDEDMKGSVASQLKKLEVSTVPPDGQWVKLAPDLEFMETVENKKKKTSGSSGEKDKSRTIVKTHMFRSSAPDAKK